MSDDAEAGRTFLSRWSRRKIEARAAEQAPADPAERTADTSAGVSGAAPVDAPVAREANVPGSRQPPQLPDPETLHGLESDYRGFLRPEVDDTLRRTALKRLFADPHFNVMDGLDIYIDDYSKPDPIPSAMLRSLNQARGLRLFEDEEEQETTADAAAQQGCAEGEAPPAVPEASVNDSTSTDCPPATETPVASLSPAGDTTKNG